MTIDDNVFAIVVEPEKLLENERREFARISMLNQLLGRQCATCSFEYNTPKDLEDHGILGGYNTDVVGKGDCWDKYVERHSIPDDDPDDDFSFVMPNY